MNVFVLCTGRCGSKTFAIACQHMTNFTAGHETLVKKRGDARLAYPANHIEADCRLIYFAGRLEAAYGGHAYYIHLRRDPEAVAYSFFRRVPSSYSIVQAHRNAVLSSPKSDLFEACRDYVRTTEENISLFLRDKDHVVIDIDDAERSFRQFWQRIGAEGDLDAALGEFKVRHNPRPARRFIAMKEILFGRPHY